MGTAEVAKAHGWFNLVFGVWPLLHYRSFAAVTGPKKEPWLVKTVGGLGAVIGVAQLKAGRSGTGLEAARTLGLGSGATFGAVDAVYGGSGRISRVYLLDAVVEALWLVAWLRARRP